MSGRSLGVTAVFVAVGVAANMHAAAAEDGALAARFVTVQGEKFIDPEGRHLILHGINIVDKSTNWSGYPSLKEPGYAVMKDWGFNCIRLGLLWANLEPEPGKYNEKCLSELDKRVQWAKKNGLYVFLDMHQDLFSMKYSDGAPEWATLTDGKPHAGEGAVWSDAYFSSAAVQTAFDNFWANKPGPDGKGIQDHYAEAWQRVAKWFANEDTVIGYDLMNEPFAGSPAPQSLLMIAGKFAQVMAEKQGANAPSIMDVMAQWGTPDGRAKLLEQMTDPQVYGKVVDAAQPLYEEFERTKLTPMFQRVTNAIREVDKHHMVFLETSVSSNMGIRSGIEPVRGKDGNRDPLQAYAPHAYDLVTDTASVAAPSNARVEVILTRHAETGKRLGMPSLVGEWGAYGNAEALAGAQFVCRQFERFLFSDTYWAYIDNIEKSPTFPALMRPYPMVVNGTILEYAAVPEARKFTCRWKEDPAIKTGSRFFVPESYAPSKERMKVVPEVKGVRVEPVREGCKNVYVIVPPAGVEIERSLSFE
jgi:endoglycosylceramidase